MSDEVSHLLVSPYICVLVWVFMRMCACLRVNECDFCAYRYTADHIFAGTLSSFDDFEKNRRCVRISRLWISLNKSSRSAHYHNPKLMLYWRRQRWKLISIREDRRLGCKHRNALPHANGLAMFTIQDYCIQCWVGIKRRIEVHTKKTRKKRISKNLLLNITKLLRSPIKVDSNKCSSTLCVRAKEVGTLNCIQMLWMLVDEQLLQHNRALNVAVPFRMLSSDCAPFTISVHCESDFRATIAYSKSKITGDCGSKICEISVIAATMAHT